MAGGLDLFLEYTFRCRNKLRVGKSKSWNKTAKNDLKNYKIYPESVHNLENAVKTV